MASETVDFKVYSSQGKLIDSFNQNTGGHAGAPCWQPTQPTKMDVVTINSFRPGKLHWGVNGWTVPPSSVWPAGSEKWTDGKAIETPLVAFEGSNTFHAKIGPFENVQPGVEEINCVFHYSDNTWGNDFKIKLNP
ncbi:MAG: hypothetical protein WA705_10425 [Candidatus Ozemobacteraceae bacterium]